MRTYFDTSVMVAAYVPEALSEIASDRIAASSDVYISELTKVELLSALALKVRAGDLARAAAEQVAETFSRHLTARAYTVLPVPCAAFDLAARRLASFTTSLRTLDALHLACCEHFELLLLTADRALGDAAAHFNLPHELLVPPAIG